MTRRDVLRTAGAAFAAPAILRSQRRAGDKPNLLFLWTDQQRADTLAVYGNHRYRVPTLNRLAAESIVFERCYVTQPVCTPSRSTVMTGLWPHQNGCVGNNIPLKPEIPTLPEMLADSAYRTAYMGKWHLGDEIFAQRGFQQWVSIEDNYIEYYSPGRDRKARSSYHHYLLGLGHKPDSPQDRFSRDFAARRPLEHCKASFLAQRAAEFIYSHRREPWILYVNFLEPHPPYFGPLDELHTGTEAPLPANFPGLGVDREPRHYAKLRPRMREVIARRLDWPEVKLQATDPEERWREALARLNRQYAGLCSLVDQAVARILWMLETTGQADNTIIVFTSDHGEMGGAHSLIQKSVMYEEAMHVPMLLRVPFRQSRQVTVAPPVSHIDLVPTLLELMGARLRAELPGESWIGLLEGRARREDHVFVEWTDMEGGPHARAVISPDGWKLALYQNDHSMLFDRRRDPLEMNNLFYQTPYRDQVRRLRHKIEQWQKRERDNLALEAATG